jgi:hypothetical protein
MIENIKKIESGSIIIDGGGDILYSSFDCIPETKRLLKEVRACDRISNEIFGVEIYKDYNVALKKVIIKEYSIYLIEFKDAQENSNDMLEIKVIVNKTREKLNRLVALDLNHNNEEILELSRKLDILIHYYITLEIDLKS